MSGLNKAILIGNLGVDPEIRYTQSGTPVTTFTLATSENWTDRDGNREKRTEWHRIVAWRKLAELCSQYLSKGRQVYIEGRIQTRNWTDQNGVEKRTTEIVASSVVFLGQGDRGDTKPAPAAEGDEYLPQQQAPESMESVDDSPF